MTNLDELRNLALQKIGRNLVNLQKMEAMLKLLVSLNQGPIPVSRFKQSLEKRVENVSRMTMGRVAQEAARLLFKTSESQQAEMEVITEAELSHSIRIEGADSGVDAWEREMLDVVAERNGLAHKMLVSFDPNSAECCERLAIALDEQRARYLPKYEHLSSLLNAYREVLPEIAGALAHDMEKWPQDPD